MGSPKRRRRIMLVSINAIIADLDRRAIMPYYPSPVAVSAQYAVGQMPVRRGPATFPILTLAENRPSRSQYVNLSEQSLNAGAQPKRKPGPNPACEVIRHPKHPRPWRNAESAVPRAWIRLRLCVAIR